MSTRRLQILFVAMTFLAGGCFVVKPPQQVATTGSAFYKQAANLHAVMTRVATEGGCKIEADSGSGEGSGSGPDGFNGKRTFHIQIRGSKESLDTVMRTLKAELEQLAGSNGATIDVAEEKEALKRGGDLVGFHFNYSAAGEAHGKVSANLDGGPETYKLGVVVQEKAP